MDVYLSPQRDERHQSDIESLAPRKVLPIVLGFQANSTVVDVVRHLCAPDCTALVLPDDFRRHNGLIEHVKMCAHHMGLEVMPLSRYLAQRKNPPTPAKASVHASATNAGVGSGIPQGVG